MKYSTVEKSVGTDEITPAQLEAINRYTRREVAAGDVFVFSVILCDNEIDRDFEQFPRASLEKLAELYMGRTGVFDHKPDAENQSARIFATEVLADDTENSAGEPYCRLKAWAYMVRCDKNSDLIREIDAGIKKEVSVGCAVEMTLCSLCGADQKASPCAHVKGREYDGKLCYHLLINPTDAYEWSFVAVPAQKNAGVVKGYGDRYKTLSDGGVTLEKLFSLRDGVLLEKAQLDRLERDYIKLKALASAGEAYTENLRREAVRAILISHPGLSAGTAGDVIRKMSLPQLEEFAKVFGASAEKKVPVRAQLAPAREPADILERQFKI